MKTEEDKDKKVRSTWCCLLLHNMIIRYRQALAGTADLSLAAKEELDGGARDLEGVLAQVDMDIGAAIKPFKALYSAEEIAEVVGESSEEDEAVADGGTIGLAAGARGRGTKRGAGARARGRGRGRGGGMSKAALRVVAVDRRTTVAADLYFARSGRHPAPASAVV